MKRFLHQGVSVLLLLVGLYPRLASGRDQPRMAERLVFSGNETDRCLKCHGMRNFAFRDLIADTHGVNFDRITNLTVAPDTFKASVHGKIACQHCHENIKEYPHDLAGGRTKVTCDASCHANDQGGKPYNHVVVYGQFTSSVHSKGLTDPANGSPRCETCHGAGNPHAIQRAKGVLSKSERMDLCINCHENRELMTARHVDPEAISSYRQSFHYKAIRFGQTTTAVCQDCHTVHAILPPDSAASSISATHIAATCGQDNCHPGVNMNFAMSGANHLKFRIEKSMLLFLEEKLFVVLTLGTMVMLVIGIILDVQKKFGWLDLLGRGMQAVLHTATGIFAGMKAFGGRALALSRKLLID